jgi:ribonuclease E
MANKMLIDASHPEETRVVVTRGQRVEEFDFESASRRQLRGNIYLAKVTRVEPSLQAAFIEYGGNRHGFLAFSEIHPDYYQIPVADRQALLEDDARAEREHERERDEERPRGGGRRRRGSSRRHRNGGEVVHANVEAIETDSAGRDDEMEASHVASDQDSTRDIVGDEPRDEAERGSADGDAPVAALPETREAAPDAVAGTEEPERAAPVETIAAVADSSLPEEAAEPWSATGETSESLGEPAYASADTDGSGYRTNSDEARHSEDDDLDDEDEDDAEAEDEEDVIEQVGGADALDEVAHRPRASRRHYKIQEVIKRRQILLVQVVKEERGNKGAALTTYLSLAGRYSVLMPNTGKGGGISRKITSAEDRKRLKELVQELEVPEGMGVILRTAGANRTKPEIKRDYEYLMRLWESVRELTLSSTAPALVYEEGSLIKRAIRDLYNKDIDDVLVAGEEAYREARDFMRMIMPAQVKAVKPYREPQPLFAQAGVEAQLDAMFSNHVTLKSGGYLVISPTEALVSIDVNSGRSTREHNIEDTALRTNLEASEEIARQLRLRDLAGLIVIDFIDMEEKRNNRAVEKKLKDCLKDDRARIQVGRISGFGLMEMSRQRIRTGVLESSSVPCAHCGGTGFVRSTPSCALQILRSVEESLLRSSTHNLVVRTRMEVAFYILNGKRAHLRELETRFGVSISVMVDESLAGTTTFALDRGDLATPIERKPTAGVRVGTIMPVDEPIEIDPTAELEREEEDAAEAEETLGAEASEEAGTDENGRRRRRRRRRRGRGDRLEAGAAAGGDEASDEEDSEEEGRPNGHGEAFEPVPASLGHVGSAEDGPGRGPGGLELPPVVAVADVGEEAFQARTGDGAALGGPERPSETSIAEKQPDEIGQREPEPEPVAVVLTPPDPDRPKRGGWWSKAKSALSGS